MPAQEQAIADRQIGARGADAKYRGTAPAFGVAPQESHPK